MTRTNQNSGLQHRDRHFGGFAMYRVSYIIQWLAIGGTSRRVSILCEKVCGECRVTFSSAVISAFEIIEFEFLSGTRAIEYGRRTSSIIVFPLIVSTNACVSKGFVEFGLFVNGNSYTEMLFCVFHGVSRLGSTTLRLARLVSSSEARYTHVRLPNIIRSTRERPPTS